MTNNTTPNELHTIVCNALAAKIQSGECNASDMKNAIEFLKNNGINGVPAPGSALQDLIETLPEFN